MSDELTVEQLHRVLSYEPNTGVFTWCISTSNRVHVGYIAGVIGYNGYRIFGIAGRKYRASRLAWLYTKGEWPAVEIDHINCNRSDDRFCNLRSVNHSNNMANTLRGKDN